MTKKEYIITEDEIQAIEEFASPAFWKDIRERERPQTVKELQEVLKHFGMRLSVEWIKEREIPSIYKNPHTDKIKPMDIGERGCSTGAAYAFSCALERLRREDTE